MADGGRDEGELGVITESRVQALGLGTRVLEAGDREADEAVVFLHGHPGLADDWRDLMPRVAPFARVVAPDMPGFGQADKPADLDYSAGTYAAFLTCLFHELGIRRAHLVLHDLGGVAVVWGLGHPDAFASCVLMGTGVLRGFRWHPVARLYRLRPVGEVLSALTNGFGFKIVMRFYNPQPRKLPKEVIDRWWANYPLATRRAALSFYRATPPEGMERLAAPLRALDVPCLVAFGAHDPAVPIEQAEIQRESFPSAEVVPFPDSGHWPYLDDPEKAASTIVPFLELQVSRGRDTSDG